MKKHIAEGLPERKHAPAAAGAAPAGKGPAGKGGGDEKGEKGKGGKSPEQRVKQAVYDIRYRARREELPLPQAFSQYMQNSSMSAQERTMVKQKLFGKGGMKAEDFNMQDAASTSVANALFRVFVEGAKEEDPIRLTYMEKLETAEHRKYKVRVTDKNGRSYVRYADRQKISDLRANPNIESVEMTGYGEPYEGEKKKGEQTAAAKSGKDYDGDGEVESGAKEYRGAVHNAIQRKKGGVPDGKDTSSVKEEFLADANEESVNPDANEPEIDVMKGKNIVKINPEVPGSEKNARSFHYAHYEAEGEMIADSYTKFLDLLQEKKMTKGEKAKEKKLKKKYDPSGMKASMKKQYGEKKGKNVYFATIRKQAMKEESDCGCEDDEMKKDKKSPTCVDDSRGLPTAMSLAKSKGQSMGMKNPLVMPVVNAGYEPEGEVIDERARARRGQPRPDPTSLSHRVWMDVRTRNRGGVATRSGQTVAQHESQRGVKKNPGSPSQPPSSTPAERLAAKKAEAKRREQQTRDMYKPRDGESD
jgi:hypothetical protein